MSSVPYILGHSNADLDSLMQQAAILKPIARRLLLEAALQAAPPTSSRGGAGRSIGGSKARVVAHVAGRDRDLSGGWVRSVPRYRITRLLVDPG